MARKQLKPGDPIQLKVKTISGYKGEGVVVSHPDGSDVVRFVKKGVDPATANSMDMKDACRHEVSLMCK